MTDVPKYSKESGTVFVLNVYNKGDFDNEQNAIVDVTILSRYENDFKNNNKRKKHE